VRAYASTSRPKSAMRPSLGRVSPLIRLKKRGFARAVGPDDRSPLARAERQTHAVDRAEAPELLAETLRLSAAAARPVTSATCTGSAVVHGLLQGNLRLVLPELRDGRVGVDDGFQSSRRPSSRPCGCRCLDRVARRCRASRTLRGVGISTCASPPGISPDSPRRR